jgi:hypothetical protein
MFPRIFFILKNAAISCVVLAMFSLYAKTFSTTNSLLLLAGNVLAYGVLYFLQNMAAETYEADESVNAKAKGNNLSMMKQMASKEYQTDAKVREFWVAEFKRVMKSKFGVFN